MKLKIGSLLPAAIVFALFPFFASVATPQDGTPLPLKRLERGGLTVECDDIKRWPEGEGFSWLLTGRVSAEGQGLSLMADVIVVWEMAGKDSQIEAIYAEGNVRFRKEGMNLTMDHLYYDVRREKGYAVNIVSRGWDKNRNLPVVVRAREAREILSGLLVLKDARLTTCAFAGSHYDFSISELEMKFDKDREGEYSGSYHAAASTVLYKLEGIPLFYLPYAAFSEGDNPPLRSLKAGKTSRFGGYVYSEWGTALRKGLMDRLNPLDDGNAEDDKKNWGDIALNLDYRRKRGWAEGLDVDYEWGNYSGRIESYYLRDRGPDPGIRFDRKFIPMENDDRGRVGLFHRHEIAPSLRGELELSRIGDRNLLPEFFEKEFKEAKEQESVIYLRWRDGNRMAYYLERHRLNDFQTQNEYLPSATFAILQEPVYSGDFADLFFSSTTQIQNLRRVFDDDLREPKRRQGRLDSMNDLTVPYDLGLLQVTPFAGGRLTLFEENLERHSEARTIASAGVRAGTNVHRTSGFTSEWLGMNGLRHIMRVEGRYANNYYSNVDADELYQFDSVDNVGKFEEVAVELRHRFLTRLKTSGSDELRTHEFMEVGVGIEYYPDRRRDTGEFHRQNFLPPFQWMTAAPDPLDGYERQTHSNIYWDFAMTPKNFLSLAAFGEYNPATEKEENREIVARFFPLDVVTVGVDQRFVSRSTQGTTYNVWWKASETWLLHLSTQFDYRIEEYIEHTMDIRRDFHDFALEIGLENDRARDERRVMFAITPGFLGKRAGDRNRLFSQGEK
ncbi:MAG: hypothetical protein A2Z34_06630 [Planctomycetes bacterium RBG_16_59_8]|nr:MAG: hypothetical protein A2Z34_06630 [Planctomycetes bacterium RBG_16_59_8]